MAIQRTTFPMSRKSPPIALPQPGSLVHSPAIRTGAMMTACGILLGIGTVVLEEQQTVPFGVGLTIGIVMLPWLLALLPSPARFLPQPGGMCALLLGAGMQVASAGLYSGRAIVLGAGVLLAIASVTVWTAASITRN